MNVYWHKTWYDQYSKQCISQLENHISILMWIQCIWFISLDAVCWATWYELIYTGSHQIIINEPIQYLSGWLLSNNSYFNQLD